MVQSLKNIFIVSCLGLSIGCGSAHIKKADLGYEAMYEGDFEQAQEDFEKSLDKVPGYEPALTGLGFLAYERGEYRDAEKFFSDAIASERTADALWGRGRARLALYHWDDAAKDLQASADATMNKANLELGQAYMLIGEGEKALRALKEFARVEDSPVERRLLGAQMAYRVGVRYDMAKDAMAVVDAFVFEEDSPSAAEGGRLMVDLAYISQDYSTAKRAARRAGDSKDFGFVFRALSPSARRSFEGYGGAVVDMVHIGSPAYVAGMRAGDILTGFQAMPITGAASLTDMLSTFHGQQSQQATALVEVLRGNTYFAYTLTLGDYDFDTPIRAARDGGSPLTVSLAADDISTWP